MRRIDHRTSRVEAAVKAHSSTLLAYFARRVDQSADAADLLAETLLTVWRRAASIPADNGEVRPWMFGIARNILMHHYRHAVRQRALVDKLRSILSVSEHAGFTDPGEHEELHTALASLPQLDRDLIGLVHWEGFTLAEASKILRMKEGTVRSRYHRAKGALRSQLGNLQTVAHEHDLKTESQ